MDMMDILFSQGLSGGESGASNLSELEDVDINSPADGDVVTWDNETNKWINKAPEEHKTPIHIYSTDPQEIGKWVNGETIYEKVFYFPNLVRIPSTFDVVGNIDCTNINKIIFVSAINVDGTCYCDVLADPAASGGLLKLRGSGTAHANVEYLIIQYIGSF